jgi:hypothetical protein
MRREVRGRIEGLDDDAARGKRIVQHEDESRPDDAGHHDREHLESHAQTLGVALAAQEMRLLLKKGQTQRVLVVEDPLLQPDEPGLLAQKRGRVAGDLRIVLRKARGDRRREGIAAGRRSSTSAHGSAGLFLLPEQAFGHFAPPKAHAYDMFRDAGDPDKRRADGL